MSPGKIVKWFGCHRSGNTCTGALEPLAKSGLAARNRPRTGAVLEDSSPFARLRHVKKAGQ